MRKLLGVIALSFGLFTSHAQADVAKMYYGFSLSDGEVERTNAGEKSLGTLSGTLGFQLLDFVGLEIELGVASDESSSMVSDPLVSYQAALVRLGYRWDRIGAYVLGGQARLDIDDSINRTNSGTAVGFGVNFFGNETTSLNFHVLDIDSGTFTSASIGFQYYFGGFR